MSISVFLSPGRVHCSAESALVSTVLGSCVAVCLWDRQFGIGGMNHFLLPRCGGAPATARYGDIAIQQLLQAMEQLGCGPMGVHAKVFGGAAVLPFGLQSETVGTQNVGVALAVLHEHGIPVVARRTGGQRGLFVRFHTATGRVMVRELMSPTHAHRSG